MGLFHKLKTMFQKTEETSQDSLTKEMQEEVEDLKIYEKGLTKTRKEFISKIDVLSKKYKNIEASYFEELEELLIMADIGVHTVMKFVDKLKERVKTEKNLTPESLKEVIIDELFILYVGNEVLSNKVKINQNGPTVFLFIGVNGVGKTTTIGKYADQLVRSGKKVLLVAGDTFRAGAIEQLEDWANRVGAEIVLGKEGSDPASVVFDGLKKGKEEQFDYILIDTAGRLQNKVNLMKELEKIHKVIAGFIEDAPHETFLVMDATTGQNGISQAKHFKEITNITGIILTKLDGTAKGGIVLAIKEEVGIPVKYIGLGERREDLQVFDIEKYIYGLFKDLL